MIHKLVNDPILQCWTSAADLTNLLQISQIQCKMSMTQLYNVGFLLLSAQNQRITSPLALHSENSPLEINQIRTFSLNKQTKYANVLRKMLLPRISILRKKF